MFDPASPCRMRPLLHTTATVCRISAGEPISHVAAEPAGSASRPPRLRQSLDDLAGILEVAGPFRLTLDRAKAERCGLQVLEVVPGVGLHAARSVVVVRDAAGQVKQLLAWWCGPPRGVVMAHARIVMHGVAERERAVTQDVSCRS